MRNVSANTRKLTTLAMLAALAIVLVALIHFPLVPAAPFLEYDPADIPIFIGTFLFGPAAGLALTAVRNKADASGKHPWKAEVTEGDTDVANETITNWYKQVYEPVITTTEEG